MNKRMRRSVLLSALVLGLAVLPAGRAPAAASTTYDFEACTQGWEATAAAAGNHTWMRVPVGDGSNWAYGYPAYDGDTLYSITSPTHAWPGGKVTIKWSMRWQYEHPQTGIDTAKLEWTSDTAAKTKNWKKVQVFGGVTNSDFPNYNKYTASFEAPSGVFRLRFTMNGDALLFGTGPAVDNIVVPTAAPKAAACA
jgi:hypothetical protein